MAHIDVTFKNAKPEDFSVYLFGTPWNKHAKEFRLAMSDSHTSLVLELTQEQLCWLKYKMDKYDLEDKEEE